MEKKHDYAFLPICEVVLFTQNSQLVIFWGFLILVVIESADKWDLVCYNLSLKLSIFYDISSEADLMVGCFVECRIRLIKSWDHAQLGSSGVNIVNLLLLKIEKRCQWIHFGILPNTWKLNVQHVYYLGCLVWALPSQFLPWHDRISGFGKYLRRCITVVSQRFFFHQGVSPTCYCFTADMLVQANWGRMRFCSKEKLARQEGLPKPMEYVVVRPK